MSRLSKLFRAAATSLAVVLLAVPLAGRAVELPDGVGIDVLAEYESETPGVEKVLFRRLTLAPGVSWAFTVPAQSLCQGTKGTLEVVDHTAGKTYNFKAGDRWDTDPGHEVTLTNTGSEMHEHLFYTMIPAK